MRLAHSVCYRLAVDKGTHVLKALAGASIKEPAQDLKSVSKIS